MVRRRRATRTKRKQRKAIRARRARRRRDESRGAIGCWSKSEEQMHVDLPVYSMIFALLKSRGLRDPPHSWLAIKEEA